MGNFTLASWRHCLFCFHERLSLVWLLACCCVLPPPVRAADSRLLAPRRRTSCPRAPELADNRAAELRSAALAPLPLRPSLLPFQSVLPTRATLLVYCLAGRMTGNLLGGGNHSSKEIYCLSYLMKNFPKHWQTFKTF